ncbi:hypothetical protein Q7P37_008856 [Cladosporium fusiforme]
MVQLKRDLPAPAPFQPVNTYWGIGGTTEETERFKKFYTDYTPNPLSADQALERKERKERGLLIYEKCTIAELKGFIKSRRLQMPKGSFRKADLITILEAADENPVFDKFASLPAELRDSIYAQYVDNLPPLPTLPHQPPLTLVSRQVRKESIPIFYSRATFAITICTNAGLLEVQTGFAPLLVYLDGAAHALTRLTSDDNFKRIQHLRIGLMTDNRDWRHVLQHRLVGVRSVDLANVGVGYNTPGSVVLDLTWGNYWPFRFARAQIGLWIASSSIARREGKHKLRKTDFNLFREHVEIFLA